MLNVNWKYIWREYSDSINSLAHDFAPSYTRPCFLSSTFMCDTASYRSEAWAWSVCILWHKLNDAIINYLLVYISGVSANCTKTYLDESQVTVTERFIMVCWMKKKLHQSH